MIGRKIIAVFFAERHESIQTKRFAAQWLAYCTV